LNPCQQQGQAQYRRSGLPFGWDGVADAWNYLPWP